MGTIDFYGSIHIKWGQTSKKTLVDANADAQCEWALTGMSKYYKFDAETSKVVVHNDAIFGM